MVQHGYLNRNVDMNDILSLLAEWDSEDFMDTPSTFHMREPCIIKSQRHDTDTTTYMEALSVENTEEYFKKMDDEIQSLTISDTWDIVSRKLVADHNVLPRTWSFKCKIKPYWTIRKFKSNIV